MKISVILPTRGLVFAEVEEAIERMRFAHDLVVFRSWNKGIPDAQNFLVDQALSVEPDYLFFIEEDTVPPPFALSDLLIADADIAFIDYSIGGWSCSARSGSGEILWCGFGCTLVKRRVFEGLEKPYFRTDKSLRLNDGVWLDKPMKYGGQDIWFCRQAAEKGFTIKQVKGECRHMQIEALGKAGVNNGQHILSQRPVIDRWQDDIELTNTPAIDTTIQIGHTPRK